MATLIDQLERFWASLPPDLADVPRHTCACACDCGSWTEEPGTPCDRCEAGQHFTEPDACPEHRAGCPQGAH